MLRIASLVAVSACAALLAACGGSGPSEADIRDALAKSPNARIGAGLGPGFRSADIKSLRKVECSEHAQKQYQCKVEVEGQQGMLVIKTTTGVRLAKSDNGWIFAE